MQPISEIYAQLKMSAVNCIWGTWSTWATCSVTCGGGNQDRTRTIDVPAANGGLECAGAATESQACNTDACPGEVLHIYMQPISELNAQLITSAVNCTWSTWSTWATCSVPCGVGGNQDRNRTIDVPAANGGLGCAGEPIESQACNTHACTGKVLNREVLKCPVRPCTHMCRFYYSLVHLNPSGGLCRFY